MKEEEHKRLRSIFIKTFASVPDPLRDEIIALVDGQPYTWESAFLEVKNNTEKSKKILEELKKIEVIS